MHHKTTLVTGLWDLGRGQMTGESWSRSFEQYKSRLKDLLISTSDSSMVIFAPESLKEFILSIRNKNIFWIKHEIEDFCGNFFPFCDTVEKIRTNTDWLNQVGWLKDSTQAKLPMYNNVVMSKMFFLHNASLFNHFNSDLFFWVDAGITGTVHPGYFSKDNVIQAIERSIDLDRFLFIRYPYSTQTEIHGFNINRMNEIAKNKVEWVCRGGFFGGSKSTISRMNGIYYQLLQETLNFGYMGTEESIFSIISYLYIDDVQLFDIESNGLIYKFFEDIKNTYKKQTPQLQKTKRILSNKTDLYINTYNSPNQLKMVLKSFEKHNSDFIDRTVKILINNSNNESLYKEYDDICNNYGMEQIREGNKGICGARQYAAERFNESDSKYMLFFEDDMLLDFDGVCNFGLKKYVPNLFNAIIKIMDKENYDFLKLSFSEFFGHNGEQWSWHNVPSKQKIEYFGNINQRPFTNFTQIKSLNQVPYAEGEIYYCNWPHIINKSGNKKMFIDTKWSHPYEQTWMSHIYTLTRNKQIHPGILLASPITHNRVEHYDKSERKES